LAAKEDERLSLSEVVSVRDVTDEFRAACLWTAVKLTARLVEVYRELPAAQEVWRPFLPLLAGVPRDRLPGNLATDLDNVREAIQNLPRKNGAVVKPAKQVNVPALSILQSEPPSPPPPPPVKLLFLSAVRQY
jgi:hypothetical protein